MANKYATRPCRRCGGSGRELDPRAIGEQMRKLRLASKKSLREVASTMRISPPYLSDLERGNRAFTECLLTLYKDALK